MTNINTYFYKKAYEKYGITAKGVHWTSSFTQKKRFEILVSFIKKDLKYSNILDVGCGFGDFLEYLNENKISYKDYLGIDCENFMVDICKKRFKNKFEKIDLLTEQIPKSDYLICSGAFNTFKNENLLKGIKKCFQSSKKGFVFNFITKISIHSLQKEEIIEYCKSLAKQIHIKNDYLDNDCTIYIKK